METSSSPERRMVSRASVSAAWPEATARAATPPSSAAMRCSSTSLVGFMMRAVDVPELLQGEERARRGPRSGSGSWWSGRWAPPATRWWGRGCSRRAAPGSPVGSSVSLRSLIGRLLWWCCRVELAGLSGPGPTDGRSLDSRRSVSGSRRAAGLRDVLRPRARRPPSPVSPGRAPRVAAERRSVSDRPTTTLRGERDARPGHASAWPPASIVRRIWRSELPHANGR